ncbi:MAG: sugar phosphate isomerase/epimerase family protein [Planctomycetota bacterium]
MTGRQRVLGVCSWSLKPGGPKELVERIQAVGLSHVQLALEPLRQGAFAVEETMNCLQEAGIEVRSGMIEMAGEDYSSLESIRRTGGVRSDGLWPRNLEVVGECAALCERLGLSLVSFHAGFLPHGAGDPLREVMIERLRQVADRLTGSGVRLMLETGQESAETLLAVLKELERPGVGINFDPANMILYGMGEPTEALARLAERVWQVHIKDALRSQQPGEWGEEVPVGSGEVDWERCLSVLEQKQLGCDLMIEREAGDKRIEEIILARNRMRRLLS